MLEDFSLLKCPAQLGSKRNRVSRSQSQKPKQSSVLSLSLACASRSRRLIIHILRLSSPTDFPSRQARLVSECFSLSARQHQTADSRFVKLIEAFSSNFFGSRHFSLAQDRFIIILHTRGSHSHTHSHTHTHTPDV
jgi:hypothetical protein